MTDTSQRPHHPRVPSGVPTGGQFAASARTEAAVDLAEQSPGERRGRDPLAAYTEAAEAIRAEHAVVTEGFEALSPQTQEERRRQVGDHYAHVALRTANQMPASTLPNPGQVLLSGPYGRLAGAAEAAATERASMFGPPSSDQVEAAADALVEKVLDTRDFTAADGIPFRARLVRRGASWGRNGSLVAEKDMVFFFDARYPDHDPMIGHSTEDRAATERNGQFIANYSVEMLRGHRTGAGLDLHSAIPDWTIDGDTYDQVIDWMDRRAPLRDNPFASAQTLDGLRTELALVAQARTSIRPASLLEARRQQDATDNAFETRRREIVRGWDSNDH